MKATEWDWSLSEFGVPSSIILRIFAGGGTAWDGEQPMLSWAAGARAYRYYERHMLTKDAAAIDLSVEFARKFLGKVGIQVDPDEYFADDDK